MPIYEYECRACGHQFEEWQKISDPPVKKCPSCGKRQVDKLVSVSSFHLKGGGWYADLYGSSGSGGGSTKSNGKATDNKKSDGKSKASSSKASSSKASTGKSATAAAKG